MDTTDERAITTQKQPPSNSYPADREIAAKIAALLLHYPIANVSEGARAQMAQDWVEDLRDFGPLIVGEGCRLWRQKPGGKRPTPGDIRALCIEAQIRHRNLANKAKNEEQAGGRWEDWLFELWGPESTGRPARDAAIAARALRMVPSYSPDDLQRQGRSINESYARAHGYANWDACWDANRDKHGLAVKIIAWMKAEGLAGRPNEHARPRAGTAGDLGVKAEPAKIEIPEGQAEFLKAELAKRPGKATGEAAE